MNTTTRPELRPHWNAVLRVLVAVTLASFFVACSDDEGTEPDGDTSGTSTTSETTTGTTGTTTGTTGTTTGTTGPECVNDGECGAGDICVDNECVLGCREDDECAGNEECINLECVEQGVGCDEEEDCAEGLICNFQTNRCEEDTGECLADSNEPNEGLGEDATELSAGVSENLSICAGDNDYFAINLSQGDSLTLDLAFSHDDGNLDLWLLSDSGQPIERATSVEDNETISFEATRDRVVYARVFGADGDVENSYSLTTSISGPECTDNFEPNNSADEATEITNGTRSGLLACSGDNDWFSFEATEGNAVEVGITFSHEDGDLAMVIQDADGNEVANSDTADDDETITFDAPATGTYYAIVTLKDGDRNAYEMFLDVEGAVVTTCETDEFEPNNLSGEAAAIELDTQYDDLIICSDDEDWYSIELSAGDIFNVEIAFVDAITDVELNLRAPDGSTTLRSALSSTDNEEIRYTIEEDGIYFIRVYSIDGFDTDGINTYSLNTFLTLPPACEDPFEENNTFETASVLDPAGEEAIDAVICAEDPDWFSIAAEAGQVLAANISVDGLFGSADIAIYDTDGTTQLALVEDASSFDEIRAIAAETGDYYIAVTMNTGDSTSYSLDWELRTPPACEDTNEPNDSTDDATVLGDTEIDAVACIGDVDFYEIVVNDPLTLVRVDLSSSTEFGDVNVAIINADGEEVATSTGTGSFEFAEFVAEQNGVYYARVSLAQGGNSEYSISAELLDVAGCYDQFETNNTIATAAPIETDVVYDGLGVCSDVDEDDYFAVELEEGQIVDFKLTFLHSEDGDLELRVYGPNEALIESSVSSSDNETIRLTIAETGTYYVRADFFSRGPIPYTLEVDVIESPECDVDPNEPNDIVDDATAYDFESAVLPGVACVGDVDLIAIEVLDAGANLTATVATSGLFGQPSLEILDQDGETVLATGELFGSTLEAEVALTASGIFYARISMEEGENTDYNFNAEVTAAPSCDLDAFEFNDILEDATPLPIGERLEDAVACIGGDIDIYAINVPAGGLFADIDLTSSGLFGDVKITLFEEDGVTVIEEAENTDIGHTFEDPGTYYVQVELIDGINQDYDLLLTFDAPANCEDGFEPNNTIEEASPITGQTIVGGLCYASDPVDVYTVDLPAGVVVRFNTEYDAFAADLSMFIAAPDGETLIANSSGFSSPQVLEAFIPEAGTYYFGLLVDEPFFNSGNTGYITSIELVDPPACDGDTFEPNDTLLEATTFDAPIEGAIACETDDDWYAIEVTDFNSTIILDGTIDVAFGDLGIEILNADGEILAETTADSDFQLRYDAELTGLYYARVFVADGEATEYNLSYSVAFCNDEFEDNNTLSSAAPISAGVYNNVGLCPDEGGDEQDWYIIGAPANSTIRVEVTFLDSLSDIQLYLYDASGVNELDSSTSFTADVEEVTFEVTEGGFFYILAESTFGQPNGYQLTIEADPYTPPVCEDDLIEPDDDFASATTISLETVGGTICPTNKDFYSFVGEQGSVYEALLTYDPVDGPLEVTLFSDDGESVILSADGGEDGNARIIFRYTGTTGYFLSVSGVGAVSGDYTLTVQDGEVQPGDCLDRFENNNTFETATPIEAGEYEDLDVCVPNDLDDYFAVELLAGQTITVNILFSDEDGDIDLHLRDTDGVTNLDTSVTSSDNEDVSATVDADGTYFIRVYHFAFAGSAANSNVYTLNVEITDP